MAALARLLAFLVHRQHTQAAVAGDRLAAQLAQAVQVAAATANLLTPLATTEQPIQEAAAADQVRLAQLETAVPAAPVSSF
jgi:hypothetical protein